MIIAVGTLAVLGVRLLMDQRGPRVAYEIRIPSHDPAAVAVIASFRGLATDSLVFEAVLQHEATRLAVDSARSDREHLHVSSTYTGKRAGDHDFSFARCAIDASERRSLDVHYHLAVGLPEGDPHQQGLTGRTYGRATADYVITSYAQLLLLPSPLGVFRRVNLDYDLPEDWTVTAALGTRAIPGRFPGGSLHDYAFAPIILGRPSTFRYDDLSLRVAVVGAAETVAPVLASRVAHVYRSAVRSFGVAPEHPYLVVIAPADTTGFATFVEPTYFGQVATRVGESIVMLDEVAERMVERVARSAGADVPFPDPADHWFLPSLVSFVSDRVVATVTPRDPLATDRVDAYVRMIYDAGDVPLASASPAQASAKGPAVLECLDTTIRESSAGVDSLMRLLPLLAKRDPGMSLQPFLEQALGRDLGDFFQRHVTGTEPLPVPALVHPRKRPEREVRREAVRDSVALVVSYDGRGYLETCGCKANMWGGIARVSTWAKRFRQSFAGPVFMLSAGNAFPMDVSNPVLDPLAEQELDLYLALLAECGFQVAAVGQSEVYHGVATLARHTGKGGTRFVSANIEPEAVPGLVPFLLLRDGGCSLGVTSVLAPEEHPLYGALWATRAAHLATTPVIPSVREAVRSTRDAGAKIAVVAGSIKPSVIRMIAEASDRQIVIVSYERLCKCTGADGELFVHDLPGFLGDDLVLYPAAGRYGVSVYVLYRDAEGMIVDFTERDVYMTEEIADDPETRRRIDQFYLSVGPSLGAEAIQASGLWASEVAEGARFAGSDACVDCHEEQHAQWLETSHSSAFKTLLKHHRQYNPVCVSCHVTGFQFESGYQFGEVTSVMANVQCESCHGPGWAHAETGGKDGILDKPDAEICTECHTADHSDMTTVNFDDYYQRIVH